MKLTLLRHGETDWNKSRRIQGRIDTELNLFGLQQAHSCAKYLASEEFDKVFTSPLSRAYKTAEIISSRKNYTINTKDELLEIDFGRWQGLVWSEIVKTHPDLFGEFERERDLSKVYQGESFQDLQNRAIQFLDFLSDAPYSNVLAVSHTGLIKVLVCHVLGLDLPKRTKFNINNLSVTRLNYSKEKGWILLSLNECEYLDNLFGVSVQQ